MALLLLRQLLLQGLLVLYEDLQLLRSFLAVCACTANQPSAAISSTHALQATSEFGKFAVSSQQQGPSQAWCPYRRGMFLLLSLCLRGCLAA